MYPTRSRRRTMIPPEEENMIAISRTAKQINDLGVPTSIGAHGQRDTQRREPPNEAVPTNEPRQDARHDLRATRC